MNILITSAGRRVALLDFFKQEIKKYSSEAKVFACDMNPQLSSACFHADEFFAVPRLSADNYIEKLLNKCLENDIRLVIPTIDTELPILTENRTTFFEKGINVIVSDSNVIEIGSNKCVTNDFFIMHGINCAKIYNKENLEYPFFVKPVNGSSSKDIFLIKNDDDFFPRILKDSSLLCFEYLDHNEFSEYTVDCYYNRNGNLRCAVPRLRIETRGGEVSKGITSKNSLVEFVFERLGFIEGARGVLTWQFFVGKNNLDVFGIELNPRFGGGFPLSYKSGANYPDWLIKEYFLSEEIPVFSGWQDNMVMLRYDEEVTFVKS